MTSWPSIPRRILLRLAGAGLFAAPMPAMAQEQGGAKTPPVPAPTSVWTEFFKGQRIWAYADRASLEPGEPLHVMMAGGPGQPKRRVRLEGFRIGAGAATPVWTSDFVDVSYIGATMSAAAIGPGWPPSLGPIDTSAWPPGCYTADIVEQTMSGLGYAVGRNKPYAGGFITEHYGNPASGLHAIQLELNRAIYMDERRRERGERFAQVAADFGVLADALAAIPLQDLGPFQAAAE